MQHVMRIDRCDGGHIGFGTVADHRFLHGIPFASRMRLTNPEQKENL
jgi:hypothetical protein